MKKRFLPSLGIAIALFGVLLLSATTHAVDQGSMIKKWVFTQFYNCIQNNINSPLERQDSGSVADSVFNGGELLLPSYNFGHSVGSNPISCRDLFKGTDNLQGVLDYAGMDKNTDWSSLEASDNFLKQIGYTQQATGNQSFRIQAHRTTHTAVYGIVSQETETEHLAGSATVSAEKDSSGQLHFSNAGFSFDNWLNPLKLEVSNGQLHAYLDINWAAQLGGCRIDAGYSQSTERWFDLPSDDIQSLYNDVEQGLANLSWRYNCTTGSGDAVTNSTETYNFTLGDIVDATDTGAYTYPDQGRRYSPANKTIESMSGQNLANTIMSNSELYTLYLYYIDKALPSDVPNRLTCSPTDTNNLVSIRLKDTDGQFKTCYANFNGQSPFDIIVNTQASTSSEGRQPYPFISQVQLSQVINWMNTVDVNTLQDVGTIEETLNMANDTSGNNGSDTTSPEDYCYESGIDSMGWIVCPAIENGKNAADGMLGVIQYWLSVDPNQVFKDQTYSAWEKFRDIANIIMIVIFLAVIFSQMTGYGIDNYGIKKILPRLIALAIMINLSYIICQIAVDISNIIGMGFYNLFHNIGVDLGIKGDQLAIAGAVDAIVAGAAGVGTMLAMFQGLSGPTLIIAVVLALIVALVAIVMFFVMLGARMMAVVLFTIISPVAFAMYILPNTQNLFKKWWQVFKACLLIFPICGALYGASFVIQAIATNGNSNFVWQMIAVVAPFLPFLVLPTLLKSAMAALGVVGGAITMMGSGLKSGIRQGAGAIQNTDRFREANQFNQEKRANERAAKTMRKLEEKQKQGIPLSARQQERLRRAQDTHLTYSQRQQENALRTPDFLNAMKNKQELAVQSESAAIARYNDSNYLAAREQGIESEAEAGRVADQEALLKGGGADFVKNGQTTKVNAQNLDDVGDFHKQALSAYHTAIANGDQARASTALAQVKAAQNILSNTKAGRAKVEKNIKDAINNGENEAVKKAASHIMDAHAATYKAASRGEHQMMLDLASGTDVGQVKQNIDNGVYATYGTADYDAQSLASADTNTLKAFADAIASGQLQGAELHQIQSAAATALQNADAGQMTIDSTVKDELQKITAGYQAPITDSQIRSVGAYEDSNGNVYRLRELKSGKFVDDDGLEVDITHFKRR